MATYGSLSEKQQNRRSMMSHDPDFKTNDEESGWRISNIASDAFALATIGVAIAGFLLALISSVLVAIHESYPPFSWWSLFYMLACIVGVIVAKGMNAIPKYHGSLIGFLSASLVFSTSAVNYFIYRNDARSEATAAGFILLSMVSIVWIFYFGESSVRAERRQVAAWMVHLNAKQKTLEEELRHQMSLLNGSRSASMQQTGRPNGALAMMEQTTPQNETFPNDAQFPAPGGASQGQQYGARANSQYPGSVMQPDKTMSNQFPEALYGQDQAQPAGPMRNNNNEEGRPLTQYPYRAKAIYNYDANPDDANEISFRKHEILEVSDVSGRWWQTKKENGETGIAPSNYLILL